MITASTAGETAGLSVRSLVPDFPKLLDFAQVFIAEQILAARSLQGFKQRPRLTRPHLGDSGLFRADRSQKCSLEVGPGS